MSHIETREVFDPTLNFFRTIRFVADPKPFEELVFPDTQTGELKDFEEWYLTILDIARRESGFGPNDEFNNNIHHFSDATVADDEFTEFLDMLGMAVDTYREAYTELSTYNSSAKVGGGLIDAAGAQAIVETVSALVKNMLEYLLDNDNLVIELMRLYYLRATARATVSENPEIPHEIKHPYVIGHTIFLDLLDIYFLSLGFDHHRILSTQMYELMNSINPDIKD